MDTTEKMRENRLRREAERRGVVLQKSRRRDPRALDYGQYMITYDGAIIAGDHERGFGLTLDDVESWLTGERIFHRALPAEEVDAEPGSVIIVKPGAVLVMAADHGRRFVAEDDGSLREISEHASLPD